MFILLLDLFSVGRGAAHSTTMHLGKSEDNLQKMIFPWHVDLGESHSGHQVPLPTEPSHQNKIYNNNLSQLSLTGFLSVFSSTTAILVEPLRERAWALNYSSLFL